MRKRSLHQTAWAQGGLKVVGRAALTRYNREVRPYRPRCAAIRKRDGERCENIASPNGKCRVHGGATPRNDEWHRTQWPTGSSANAEAKLNDKLKRKDRDARRKAVKLAAMSPEERKRYDAWRRARKPGSAAERERLRRERKQAAEFREGIEQTKEPVLTPERAELHRQLKELETERARLALLPNDDDGNLGVFA